MKKYEGSYKSFNDTEWSVELFDETVDTETRDLKIAGLSIEWDGENDKLYQSPIKTSRATIGFVMRDENDFGNFELISQDQEQQWSVRIYRGGQLYWVGRVLADQMVFNREARETGYAIISVTAVDGLNLLANYKVDASMFTIGDRQDIISLFVLILRKLGLEGAWSSDPYIYDQTQIGNTTAAGERIMFDTVRSLAFVDNFDIFKDPDTIEWVDCKTALEMLLNGVLLGARLIHERGAYWILHPSNYDDDTWTYDSYDENGTPLLLDTGYNHRKIIDADADRPKFESYPEQSYQQPVRKIEAEFDRRNGVLEYKNTSNTTSISAVHSDIRNGATIPGHVIKVNITVSFDYYSPNAINKYEILYRVYANNPSSSQKYEWFNGAWAAIGSTPGNNKIKIDEPEWKAGSHTVSQLLEFNEPPSGASEIYAQVSMQRRTGKITGSTRSGTVIVSWATPTVAAYAFTGYVVISQAYNTEATYKFEQRQNYISALDAPRDTNSENPKIKLDFYKGKTNDVGSVNVYNGSSYVNAGDFTAPWTSLQGDLPELFANTYTALYSDFMPTIRCVIHDDGNLNAIDSLYFDNKIWIFNGGRFDTDLDVWVGTWLGVESVFTNVNNDGEGERVFKKDEVIIDQLGDIQRELTRLRTVLGAATDNILIDFINMGEGSPSIDPAADANYNFKIGYRYNSGEPYLVPVIDEHGEATWVLVKKQFDETKNADTTLSADTSLTLDLQVGHNYTIRGRIFVTGDAAADFKYFFEVSGVADRFQWFEKTISTGGGISSNNRILTTPDTVGNVIAITDRTTIEFEGTIQTIAGCSIAFNWAQNTSDATDTTVLMGSYLEWMRFRIPAVYSLTADVAEIEVSGVDAALRQITTLTADTSSIEVSGVDADFAVVDGDAAAFITAASITDATQKSAINTLVSDLKTNSLWTKMRAIYPFVGGSAASHKYNLKNPLDTDAAFRLTMNGGLTHDANGVTGNGSTGYMDTHFKDSDFNGQNDAGVAVYCRNNFSDGSFALYGAIDSSFTGLRFLPKLSSTAYFSVFASTGSGQSNTDTSGIWIHTRTGASADKMYRNGSSFKTNNLTSGTNTTTANILILAIDYNNGALKYQQSAANIAFFAFVDGLSDGDKVTLNTIISDFNTTLSR